MDHSFSGPRHRRVTHRLAGGIILLIALALTATAALIIFWPGDETRATHPSPPALSLQVAVMQVSTATPFPTSPPPLPTPTLDWVRPTAAAGEIAAALSIPVDTAPPSGSIPRHLNALTVLPIRVRSGLVTYTVKKDDNLQSIADRFGLDQSTIIWSNDRFYVNAMRVGLELTILPVNGVYHHVVDPETIQTIANEYAVDPYAIIDSEFNTLFGARPDTILPSGLNVVVPGGTGSTEPVYWDPGITMTSGSSASGAGVNAGTDYASFAVGDPGSCGRQAVVGGSPPYSSPVHSNYSITQDFSWVHGGIDLAVPVGTGVFAAGGGTVIFSGWSTWGYGYTVVIAHGGSLSIYGHLNGALVGCGQNVSAGQGIAVSGSSGNSSGPHLHFEIRGGSGAPVSPWNYQSF